MRRSVFLAAAAMVAISVACPPSANAQSAEPRLGYVEELAPDARLIGSGIVMLGIGYAGSILVASQSTLEADNKLYIPVAGPWIDLAQRGRCRGVNRFCDAETANKVLLVADGVFQGLGALQIVGGFLFPVAVSVPTAASNKPHVRVTPTAGREGYGIMANGTF